MQTQTTVIFHSGDYDGEFCREIARHFLKSDILTFIGWDYGDPKLIFPETGQVYVLDLNPECFKEFPGIDVAQKRVVWIDHHKTAIDQWGTYLPGYRIEGVAACRLAWQWFSDEHIAGVPIPQPLPTLQDFLERKVQEPLAVRLVGEYDIWDHRGDGDLEFQLGLRAQEEIPWELLLTDGDAQTRAPAEAFVGRLIQTGRFVQTYVRKQSAFTMKNAFILKWRGLAWLALNNTSKNSQVFESLDKPETGHDALMKFNWTGRVWDFSLYHAKHRTDLNLSDIAKAYGGGGHPGACGFRVTQIPFPLYPV